MEYQISIKKCVQVSPDDWELFTQSLKVTSDTTIGEIDKWIRKEFKDVTMGAKMDFHVVQLQSLTD